MNTHILAIITLSVALWMSPATAGSSSAALENPVVVLFGDSITAGYGLPEDKSLPQQLKAWFEENGRVLEIRNGGLSGDTTSGGRERIDWTMSDDVDVAVVALGGNDMMRAIPPSETSKNLESIIKQIQARDIRVILAGMLARPNYGPDYEDEFNRIYPDLADQYDLALYPFLLDGVAAVPDLNQPDGIHPNAEGVERIVSTLGPFLDSALFPDQDGIALTGE